MEADRIDLYRKRGRLGQLRAFCHAARLESFAGAAERLRLDPLMVSLHVRELEQELELPLFERNGPRIALTPAGRRLHEMARPLVDGMDNLPDTFAARLDDVSTGKVAIGAGPAAASFLLPRYLKRFRSEYPGLRVSVTAATQQVLLARLRAGDVEVALAREASDHEGLLYRPILRYRIVVITPEDHALAGREAVSGEELSEWPAIAPDFGLSGRPLARAITLGAGVRLNLTGNAGGWVEVKRWVEAGLGIALYPSFGITDRDRVSVVALRHPGPEPSYGLFTRSEELPSSAAERLIRIIESPSPAPSGASPR